MRKFLTYAIFVLLFFIAGIVLANFIIMPAIVRMGQEVSVPNVCSLPLDSAIHVLKTKGLQGVVKERRYDQIIDEGKVIIQEPLPDTKVKRSRIINLSISLGVETVTMPYLFGTGYDKGKLIIQNLGLQIESVDSVMSDSVPAGRIIKTIPEFDSEVKKGDLVKVIISKGIVLKMPNLIGIKLEQAKDELKRLGLVLGTIAEVEGSGTKGNVMVQDPQADKVVHAGDTVSLMIIK